MALGIKINCNNCRESCAQKLKYWQCAKLFAPTREALIARIHELQRRVEMLEELKDIDGIKREVRAHTVALLNILRQREADHGGR